MVPRPCDYINTETAMSPLSHSRPAERKRMPSSYVSAIEPKNINVRNHVRDTLRLLIRPGDVHELRCLDYTPNGRFPKTVAGFYDDLDRMADDAVMYDGSCKGVYVTLNPVAPALLARSCNRVIEGADKGVSSSDKDVVRRRWLPIDFDPDRPSGISSSDTEHASALRRARECRDWLASMGWPDPILADSGNGAHLLYPTDLPNDDDTRTLLSSVLSAVSGRVGGGGVKVDTVIFNAARIWKLYGTLTMKGDNIPDRPHRRSRVLERPASLVVVGREMIERVVAATAPATATTTPATSSPQRPLRQPATWTTTTSGPATPGGKLVGDTFDVPGWLARHGLEVGKEEEYKGGRKWVLTACPFNPEHTGTCAVVFQGAEGRLGFKCSHNSCKGKGWRSLREHFGEAVGEGEGEEAVGRRPSAASRIVRAALDATELFMTPNREKYIVYPATTPAGKRRAVAMINSGECRDWLAGLAGDEVVGKNAVADAVSTLEARAASCGVVRPVHLRVARHEGRLYVDLADDLGRAVQVAADGWDVITDPPVMFRRPSNMAPLPVPLKGGDVELLRKHLNVTDEDWPLARGFVLDACKGRGPYFGGYGNGPQGSAKSTFCRRIRACVDPVHAGPLAGRPKDEQAVAVQVTNNAMLAYDNVSAVPQWLSDMWCSIMTGAGYSFRKLYTDHEQGVIDGSRPILINGIPDVSEAPDLLDRCLKFTCPVITGRKLESDLDAAFLDDLPAILGGIMDCLSSGLTHYDAVGKVIQPPRMADASVWVTACEMGMDAAGQFLNAYERCRADLDAMVLDNSTVAEALLRWLDAERVTTWTGTASALLEKLKAVAANTVVWQTDFPKKPKALSDALKRLEPNLIRAGVVIDRPRTKKARLLVIERRPVTQGDAGDAQPPYFPSLPLIEKKSDGVGDVQGKSGTPLPAASPASPCVTSHGADDPSPVTPPAAEEDINGFNECGPELPGDDPPAPVIVTGQRVKVGFLPDVVGEVVRVQEKDGKVKVRVEWEWDRQKIDHYPPAVKKRLFATTAGRSVVVVEPHELALAA